MLNLFKEFIALIRIYQRIEVWSWNEIEWLKIRVTHKRSLFYNLILDLLLNHYSLIKHPYRFKA